MAYLEWVLVSSSSIVAQLHSSEVVEHGSKAVVGVALRRAVEGVSRGSVLVWKGETESEVQQMASSHLARH